MLGAQDTGMGLRSKLILAVVAVVAAGFAGAGLLATHYAEVLLLEEVRVRGRALLSAMVPPCAIAMANGEFEKVDNYVGQVSDTRRARDLHLEYVMVLDHRGRIYSHSNPTRFGEQPGGAFFQAASSHNESLVRRHERPGQAALLEITAPIVSGVRWGTLIAGFSLEREERTLAAAQTRAFVAAGVLGGTSGLVLFLVLTASVLTPVRRLASASRAFAEGDLTERVTVQGADELTELGTTFNDMAAELHSYTQDLERKVQERAAEIVAKNQELTRLNAELEHKSAQLEKLATTDGLTGLFNHRHFQERLAFETQRSARQIHPLSLILIDVDHFKHYNDENGHPAGDAVLMRLAELFRDNLRGVDMVARYGGEEFVILLLDTDVWGGRAAAEKIRAAIEAEPFASQDKQPLGNLTVSLGVATFPVHGQTPADLVSAADRALYEAKAAGRNRAVVATKGARRRD